MNKELLERFLRYVKIDTESDDKSTSYPSTAKQLDFGRMLVAELKDMGIQNAQMDSYGYVTASIASNIDKDVPTVAFIAHMDTSPDLTGKDVNPIVHEDYSGDNILLNKEKNIVLSTEEFPEMLDYIGETLITTDGNTLLGADDKAGIAEIMTAAHYLMQNQEVKHGEVKIAFTPDEEIGRGVDHFNVKKFNADFAYTLDGGPIGELEYENFNAAVAKIKISGKNIHPGYAKNRMVNAMQVAFEFDALLPANERPEYTEKYEGFYHPVGFTGSVDNAELTYIIRDHDKALFNQRKEMVKTAVQFVNNKYANNIMELELVDQYYNMKEKVEPVFHIVELAKSAMEELNITPHVIPIRGGTDGARLSYMGLPCPNIFAGGHNFHGRYEFVPLESMEKAVQVILKITEKLTHS